MNGIINKVKHKGSFIPYISVKGVKVYNRKSIANEFVKSYTNLGGLLAGKIDRSKMTSDEYISKIPRVVKSLVFTETSNAEIQGIINKMPNKTSSRHNKLSNVLLKKLSHSLVYLLTIIFNQSIMTGTFPLLMKIAEVIPLYKGREEDMIVNYQPVSLLMTISKVLEKIIYKHLYQFLSKNGIFYESQYGFRMQHSCDHAILEMVVQLLQARNDGEHCTGIFLDLSKAFDTLDHALLMKKLERYRVRGITLNWFRSYLLDRSLVAKITDITNKVTYSEHHNVTYGTAQGSCLGPLLFVIFCNDIHQLDLFGKLILFTNDTTLINTNKSKKYLEYQMHHGMSKLMDWFRANKLSLNLSKMVLIRFWRGSESYAELKLEGLSIPEVEFTKFLGVYLDKDLNWEHHMSQLYNKINSNRHLLGLSKIFG